MRATLALMLMPSAATAAPCSWVGSDIPPLHLQGGQVVVQRLYQCPHDARGELTIAIRAIRAGAEAAIKKISIEPRGKWMRNKKLFERPYANDLCPEVAPKGVRTELVGRGGEEKHVYSQPVEVKISGTGDMKALAWKSQISMRCHACPRRSGSLQFKEGRAHASRLNNKTRIIGNASIEWFQCVRRHGDLTLRIFEGGGKKRLMTLLRPVLEISGLEKKFKRKGKEFVLDLPSPVGPLCKKLGRGKTSTILWELWGRGELMHINGGGRSWLKVDCR